MVKFTKFGTYIDEYFSFKVIYWRSGGLLPVTCFYIFSVITVTLCPMYNSNTAFFSTPDLAPSLKIAIHFQKDLLYSEIDIGFLNISLRLHRSQFKLKNNNFVKRCLKTDIWTNHY